MPLLSSFSPVPSGHRSRRSGSGAAWWVHLLGAIALVAGLFLPLTDLGQAIAAPNGSSSVVPRFQTGDDTVPAAPVQVAAVGDFQEALGCGAFDPYCQTTQLLNNDGIWTGVFAVPPGSYGWQIAAVAQDGAVSLYGDAGLGGGPDQVDVDDDEIGVYFDLNTHTNETAAESVSNLLSVQVDGLAYALRPGDAGFTALVSSPGGSATFQLFSGSEPLTDPQGTELAPGPNRLTFSTDGQLVNIEPLTPGSVTVQRVDTAGAPLAGGCYQLRDGSDIVNQGCDADDGSLDGNTFMTFPEGVPGGSVTVIEITTPDGAEPIDDQELGLEAGDMFVSLQPAASGEDGGDADGEGDADQEEDGQVIDAGDTTISQGEDGQVIEAGDVTISQGEDGQTIDLGDDEGEDDQDEDQPVDAENQVPGNLLVSLEDAQGQSVGGACFELVQDGNVVVESCDTPEFEQNPGNGTTGFYGIPSGAYTLRNSENPDDLPLADEIEVDVTSAPPDVTALVQLPDDDEEATVDPTVVPDDDEATTDQAAALDDVATGDVVVLRQDPSGAAVGGACFEIVDQSGGVIAEEVCDEDGDAPDDGRIGFFDVPEGTWVLRESRPPEGFEQATEGPITIVADSVFDQPVASDALSTDEPTVEATEESTEEDSEPGNLTVTLLNPDQTPIGGACFALLQDGAQVAEACDTPEQESEEFANNGNTGFFDVPAGDYTLSMTVGPEGVTVEEREVEIAPGSDDTVTVTVEAAQVTDPLVPADDIATPTPVPTATEEAVDIASDDGESEPGPPGDLIVTLQDEGGQPIGDACFEIVMEGQDAIEFCDSDDPFPGNGNTGFFGVPSGTYTVSQTQVPDGTNAIESTEVAVEPGELLTEIVNPGASGGQGDDDIQIIQGEDGQVIQSQDGDSDDGDGGGIRVDVSDLDGDTICVQLDTGGDIGLNNPPAACDNGDGDESGEDGEIELGNIPPGDYVLSVIFGADGVEPLDVTIVDGERIDVELGQVTSIPTAVPTEAPTTGTLRITVTDPDGTRLGGACFDVSNDAGTFGFCDEDGDGIIDIPDVVFDEQSVVQTEASVGYALADEQEIEVSQENQNAELSVVNEPALGTVEVTSEDEDGDELPGACVSIGQGEQVCDDDGDGEITLDVSSTGVEQTISQTQAPDGYQPAADQAVLVESDDTVEVVFTNQASTGTIRAVSADANLTELGGACISLDGAEPVCDTDGDSVILFENVPVGEHTLSQTTPPPGYQTAGEQTATVDANEQTDVLFTNAAATGTILVTVQNDDGEPVADGVCVAYQAENADPVTTCETTDDDRFRFDGVAPGSYAVFASTVPEDYVLPDESTTVEVVAGQEATATITLTDISAVQGGALLNFQSEDGAAVAGLCFQLNPEDGGEPLGPYCDNDGNDQDATEGLVLLQGLPQGMYGIQFLQGDFGVAALDGESAGSITIEAGVTIEQVITVPGLFLMGSIQIQTVDSGSDELLGGACYTISTAEPMEVCDNNDDGTDLTADAGIILIGDIDAGDYTVSLTTPPSGYSGASEQTATVVGGQTAQLTFEVDAEETNGTLVVNKVDAAGEPLGGTCFRLQNTSGTVAEVCDTVEGVNDGTVTFSDVPADSYQLIETRTPGNQYQPASARSVEIDAGETVTVEVVNTLAPGRLYVIKVDAGDPSVRLEDACFLLDGPTTYGPYCDGDDLTVDGRIVFNNVVPDDYTLVETQAPNGYDPAPERTVVIEPATTLQVTVENSATPPPPEAGTLVVNKVDVNNDPLAGGCFRLYDDDNDWVTAQVCDISDGTNDARIVFEDVPVGTWTLRETLAPSPSFQIASDQQVTIEDDETTVVDVVNRLKSGRVLVHKVTEQGHPIEGACFDLDGDGQGEQCSNAAGELLFENVPVGSYTLNERVVPYGFREAEPVEGIRVNPGQTTVVTVENERQPPPNTGSVQVLKFVCSVETADEQRTVFLGGAAGDAQLAQTVGCSPSNAEFTLVGEDGSDGPGAFRTGDDGQYQVTVPAEIYRLDETNPDLPGNSAALLRVEVGRLTTVVVINYIAPPAPAPVDISVAKYTCQAGFNGTTYEDFAASCMNDSQLTNGITVRAEGEVDLKAVTGDGGQRGRTAFVDQPSGTYTIYEERPYNIPTNYGFCGSDGNWPADYKTVNGSITAELGEGENLSCVFFNIPEQVTDDTGVILVRKFTCDVNEPAKGYNFEEECRLSDENAQFELKRFNEELQDYDDEGTVVTANPDGFARYPNLRPGTYQLREVGSNWCHANSDSVNADGDVVVNAGAVSQVWIYNCVDTEVPPNTGSGDAAELLDPDNQAPETPAPGGNRATPGVAWPVLVAAVVAALWPRKVLAPAVIRNQVHRDAA